MGMINIQKQNNFQYKINYSENKGGSSTSKKIIHFDWEKLFDITKVLKTDLRTEEISDLDERVFMKIDTDAINSAQKDDFFKNLIVSDNIYKKLYKLKEK